VQTIPIKLAFHDWVRDGKSIYSTEEGIELSLGDFHSGTVFNGAICLDDNGIQEIQRAIARKEYPTFLIFSLTVNP